MFCDYLSYIFMFLSVATSNMVATSLAKKVRPLILSETHSSSVLIMFQNSLWSSLSGEEDINLSYEQYFCPSCSTHLGLVWINEVD